MLVNVETTPTDHHAVGSWSAGTDVMYKKEHVCVHTCDA